MLGFMACPEARDEAIKRQRRVAVTRLVFYVAGNIISSGILLPESFLSAVHGVRRQIR